MPLKVLLRIFRVAKLHELLGLRAACHQRMGEIGPDLLTHDGVFDLLRGDEVLYNEVVKG